MRTSPSFPLWVMCITSALGCILTLSSMQAQTSQVGTDTAKTVVNDPNPDEFIPDVSMPSFDERELQRNIKYPDLARNNNIQGKVVLRVLVSESGKPLRYQVDFSENKIFEQAAADAVMHTTFSPALQNGKPVRVWISIPVVFKLTQPQPPAHQ